MRTKTAPPPTSARCRSGSRTPGSSATGRSRLPDPRVAEYARLLVERCVDVQPGWQVMVQAGVLARPLYEEVVRLIARRGAYVLPRLDFSLTGGGPANDLWAAEAPLELLERLPAIEQHALEQIDALVVLLAPENTRDGSNITVERERALGRALEPVIPRFVSDDFPWVGCQYPTPALAQDAGMSLAAFEDFLYDACLRDWDAEGRRMQRIADRFDAAEDVRIVGAETDLVFSLAGRRGRVDDGRSNMPGGEVFYSPVEDSAEGRIAFVEFSAELGGNEIRGIRLRFEHGRVAEASAESNEEYFLARLDTDEGARRLGEFGIGCNPAIQRPLLHPLYDEKIDGTIHLALGHGFPFLGGTNESTLHWDIVKDLRQGGQLYADDELVQENGRWLL